MKDSRKVIEDTIRGFRDKYGLSWGDIVIGTGGDVLEALTNQKVLYCKEFRPDFIAFEPESIAEADSIVAEFQAEGAKVVQEKRFGERIFLFAFSMKVPIPVGPLPPLPKVPNWEQPFPVHKRLNSATTPGEKTPFWFKGEIYRLDNIGGDPLHQLGKTTRTCNIRRDADDKLIAEHIFPHHYFAFAFVWQDRCYCYAENDSNQHHLDYIYSDDLVHWSQPQTVIDLTDLGQSIFNNSVTWDGKRFVMACETNDSSYPIFTPKFLESADLIHWKFIPNAMFVPDRYAGGPALYWNQNDGYYYFCYVDQVLHPTVHRLYYRNSISRSRDLINWQDPPEGRAIVVPDFNFRPFPDAYPDVYEFNTSDVEFIEDNGKLRIYFSGGNQLGVGDDQTAEREGTLLDTLSSFFK
ncbi:MAG: hypothetical protein J6866_05540 [Victivallales bacterium]|nr:hypothetical protein [Victivallales bacterium]